MDPESDRRHTERRQGTTWQLALKVLGSPVSIIILLGTMMISTVNLVQRADHSVQEDAYAYDRKVDAILLRQSLDSLRDGIAEVNFRVIELSDDQKAERARSDSVIRILRHTICRQDPDACP